MITKNFHPNYDGNMRFAYHDDQIWKGNRPFLMDMYKKYSKRNLEFSEINKKRTKLGKEIDNR
ncbi:hypothetical protein [uncultured Thomasclavelia sp.]|uniref:hypothetical protein n=1 Tax=uncultured Thomasclavelia sp. TaxID=3025759 RepID=UPI0026092235|nr:hypothetical protein [uncultured Thomasclavelia sp.]